MCVNTCLRFFIFCFFLFVVFFFNDTATTEIYTLSLHDALPISRSLFNLGQSRKFMQSLLLAKGCHELIDAEKTLSLRGMYYMALHTIPGTKERDRKSTRLNSSH